MTEEGEKIPREYQVQLFETAKTRNSLICLQTGTGKTFIAVMLIKEYKLELDGVDGKRTFFLVPTRPLVAQQAKEIRTHTGLKVAEFTGDSYVEGVHVDKWDQAVWDQHMASFEVIVLTAQIFLNIISHAYVPVNRINLVIFDEAHWAGPTKTGKKSKHPYGQIMSIINEKPKSERPKILGLSASLIKNRVKPERIVDTLNQLESTYDAACITCDYELLGTYGTCPQEEIVVYSSDMAPPVCLHAAELLQNVHSFLQQSKDEMKATRDLNARKSAVDDFDDGQELSLPSLPISVGDLRKSLYYTFVVLKVMGPWCALRCVTHYKNYLSQVLKVYKGVVSEYDHIVDAIVRLFSCCEDMLTAFLENKSQNDVYFSYVSPKMLALLEILKRFDNNSNIKLAGIVFVQSRAQCKALCEWLQAVASFNVDYQHVKADFTVGTSAQPGFMTSVASTDAKEQANTLQAFKDGAKNLIVATSVLEEGLDVPRCNLVIRFDVPNTFRGWLQSKGRARAEQAFYVMMSKNDDRLATQEEIKYFRGVEKALNGLCTMRKDATDHVVEEYHNEEPRGLDEEDLVSGIGAKITLISAKMIVQMYCDRLPHDVFTSLSPLEKYERSKAGTYRCSVLMPINSAIHSVVQGPWKTSRNAACRCTYLQICKILYECKELDEHLAPAKRTIALLAMLRELDLDFSAEKEAEREEAGANPGSRSRRQPYERPQDVLLSNQVTFVHGQKCTLFVVAMAPKYEYLKSKFEKGLGFVSCAEEDSAKIDSCSFPIFNRRGQVDVKFEKSAHLLLSSSQLDALYEFNRYVFGEALGYDDNGHVEFENAERASYFFVPLTPRNTIDWDCILTCVNVSQMEKDEQLKDLHDYKSYERSVVYTTYQQQPKFRYYRVLKVDFSKNPKSQFDDPTKYKNYVEYYKKYDLNIRDFTQPLLQVEPAALSLSKITPKGIRSQKKQTMYLVPELCRTFPLPYSFWFGLMSVPAIIFRLNNLLCSRTLQKLVEKEVFSNKLASSHDWQPFSLCPSDEVPGSDEDMDQQPVDPPVEVVKPIDEVMAEVEQASTDGKDEIILDRFQFKRHHSNDDDDEDSSDDDHALDDEDEDLEKFMAKVEAASEQRSHKKLRVDGGALQVTNPSIPERLLAAADESHLHNPNFVAKYPDFDSSTFVNQIKTTIKSSIDGLLERRDTFETDANNKEQVSEEDLVEISMQVDMRVKTYDVQPQAAIAGPSSHLIMQALTARNACDHFNFERLETIGDSFLKFATCAFLYFKYPLLDEGRLTRLKSVMVSNYNLYRLAKKKQIPQFIVYEQFEPTIHYVPPGYKAKDSRQQLSDKTVADCTEALIGAYLVTCGPIGAVMFMSWLGLKVAINPVNLESNHWLPEPPSPIPSYVTDHSDAEQKLNALYRRSKMWEFERKINYTFKNKGYLVEALTHSSYHFNTVTACNQRLEFLGDAVLDYVVTYYIYQDRDHDFSPGQLTFLRQALVNNSFFGSMAVKYGFDKHMLYFSHDAMNAIGAFVDRFKQNKSKYVLGAFLLVSEAETCTEEEIEVPKLLGDVFESVAGAIYLDSGLSLDTVYSVYYRLMREELNHFSKNVPVQPVRYLY